MKTTAARTASNAIHVVTCNTDKALERKRLIKIGSECSVSVGMILCYAKPEKAEEIKDAIISYARLLVSQNIAPGREADFYEGKNPFID